MKYLVIILVSFLIASTVGVVGVFILQAVGVIGRADTDMKNLPFGIAIGFNLLLALGTFPAFLNLKARVRNHFLWSTLSFFVLPLVIMGYLCLSLEEESWTGVLFCIPYFVILSALFLRFRHQKRTFKELI